jgi:hypothetical protein
MAYLLESGTFEKLNILSNVDQNAYFYMKNSLTHSLKHCVFGCGTVEMKIQPLG